MVRVQSNERHSADGYIPLLPLRTSQEDCRVKNVLTVETSYCENNKNLHSYTVVLGDQTKVPVKSKRQQLFRKISTIHLCSLLSIILIAVVIIEFFIIIQSKMKCNHLLDVHARNDEIIQQLRANQSINGEDIQAMNITQLESETNQSITEEDDQPNDNETSSILTINAIDEEDKKFTEGSKCGCQQWCSERRSAAYGVCVDGPRCLCAHNPITKEYIGDRCTCDGWCKRHGYQAGGICGDGYTCICSV